MKFGQLIEYNMKIFFFKNNAENDAGRLFPDLFLFLKKRFMKKKQVVSTLISIHFW